MKLRHIVIAGTAFLSLGAIAAEAQARGDRQAQSIEGQAAQRGQAALSSDVIKQVQEKLSAAGHDVGAADGIMGPKTRQGLRAFQQAKGIDATGQLNQQTLAALGVESAAIGATPGAAPERGAAVQTPSSPSESAPARSGTPQPQSQSQQKSRY